MERLTTNKPVSEMEWFELVHNCCYADENRSARYRDFTDDIDARELARKLMYMYGEWEIDNDAMLSDEIFDFEMADNLRYGIEEMKGLIAQFYLHLWVMAELREGLKYWEDLEEQGLLLKLPCKPKLQ